jgi:glycosyltransferase involved in cell wall biosynthesis
MKVVLANKYYYLKGGADRYLLDLQKMLEAHGNAVIPFTMKSPRNLPTPYEKYFVSEVETEKVKIGWQGLRTLGRMMFSFEAQQKMNQLIKEEKPNLVHAHNVYYQISPTVFLPIREHGIPLVMTVHDYHLISPQYMRWSRGRVEDWGRAGVIEGALARYHKNSFFASLASSATYHLHNRMGLYHLVDRYITPSKFVKGELVKKGFSTERIHVLPYGIEAAHVLPYIGRDNGYVLFVGRLVEEKGIWPLLRAAKNLPHVSFKIVGDGPEREKMQRWAIDVPNVEFVGFKSGEELWQLYREARCIVVPSLWQEVFGLVALEAMAVGKPVIASNIGGLPEVVQDRVTGLLVPPGSIVELAEAVDRLMRDGAYAASLGAAGRQKVLLDFTQEKHYRGLLEIYKEAIAEHHGKM